MQRSLCAQRKVRNRGNTTIYRTHALMLVDAVMGKYSSSIPPNCLSRFCFIPFVSVVVLKGEFDCAACRLIGRQEEKNEINLFKQLISPYSENHETMYQECTVRCTRGVFQLKLIRVSVAKNRNIHTGKQGRGVRSCSKAAFSASDFVEETEFPFLSV